MLTTFRVLPPSQGQGPQLEASTESMPLLLPLVTCSTPPEVLRGGAWYMAPDSNSLAAIFPSISGSFLRSSSSRNPPLTLPSERLHAHRARSQNFRNCGDLLQPETQYRCGTSPDLGPAYAPSFSRVTQRKQILHLCKVFLRVKCQTGKVLLLSYGLYHYAGA